MWWKEKGKKEDNNLQQYNNKVCAPFLSCYHTPLCITNELLVVCPPTWIGCSLLRVRSMGILVVLAGLSECRGYTVRMSAMHDEQGTVVTQYHHVESVERICRGKVRWCQNILIGVEHHACLQ